MTIMFNERPGVRLASERGARTPAAEFAGRIAELHLRQLGANDLPGVEKHLLALGPLDRRARFLTDSPDKMIAAYTRGMDSSLTVLVGAFDQSGRMVGLAEAHPTESPDAVEIAVSIEPAFRRCGVGQRLVVRALALAFARGAQAAEFVFAPTNRALAGLVQALGGRITAPGQARIDRSAIRAERNAA